MRVVVRLRVKVKRKEGVVVLMNRQQIRVPKKMVAGELHWFPGKIFRHTYILATFQQKREIF